MSASWETWVNRLFGGIAAVLLFIMMSLTFVDVVSRYVFNAPLPGGFELTELLLASLVFLGMPLVTLHREHVSVDLFDKLVPRALRGLRDLLVQAACTLCAAVLCWRMWHKSMESVEYGDITSVLNLPLAPVFFLGTLAIAAMAVIFFVLMWRRSELHGEDHDGGQGA